MKIAKAIESPVYSKRTEVEINEQMRTKLISTNLGLDIPGKWITTEYATFKLIIQIHPISPRQSSTSINSIPKSLLTDQFTTLGWTSSSSAS
jgi:hypothetical protein